MEALLIPTVFKVTVLLTLAWFLTRCMTRFSAASRHLIWTMALAGSLVLPAVAWLAPSWDVALLPAMQSPARAETPASDRSQPLPPLERADPRQTAPGRASIPAESTVAAPVTPSPVRAPQDPAGTALPTTGMRWPAINWPLALVAMWSVVASLALVWLVVALASVTWLTRRAHDVLDTEWLDLFDEAAGTLGVTRRVALKSSDRTTVPLACGLWRPTVLLPADATEWPTERRRVVLLHELAHVARRDCLVQALAQAARALYWFHPLAHLAVSRLRAEQERACDDRVLAAGTDGAAYADHLFDIARGFVSERFPVWATLAMARPSQLEGRVMAILDDRHDRRAPGRRVCAAAVATTLALLLPIGALQVTAAARPEAGVAEVKVSGAATTSVADWRDVTSQTWDAGVDADQDVPLIANDGIDAIVNAAAEMLEVLPDLSFDLDLDLDMFDAFDADRDPDPDVNPDLDPDPNPDPRPGARPRTLSVPTMSLAQAPTPAPAPARPGQSATTTVSDETRRRVADALLTALDDSSPDVRMQALTALTNMRDERAIPGLLKALGDASPDVRQRALSGLSQFSTPEAAQGVVAALKDADAEVRAQAARSVNALISRGLLRDAQYTDLLIGLLRDTNPEVKVSAIEALGNARRVEAVAVLLPLLKDANIEVREETASALGEIADPSAIDALTAALKDPEVDVREQAARALGQIARGQRRNVPQPVPPLPPLPPGTAPLRPGAAIPPRPPSVFVVPDIDTDAIREEALARVQEELANLERNENLFRSNANEWRRQFEALQREFQRLR